MNINGTYINKKVFVGFDDDFNNRYISKEDALKLTEKSKEYEKDETVMAMIYSRITAEVKDNTLLLKFDTEFDDIAKKLAKANQMEANDGKYFVMKYDMKKIDDTKYQVTSEDGEDSGEVEFSENTFEFCFNEYEKI